MYDVPCLVVSVVSKQKQKLELQRDVIHDENRVERTSENWSNLENQHHSRDTATEAAVTE